MVSQNNYQHQSYHTSQLYFQFCRLSLGTILQALKLIYVLKYDQRTFSLPGCLMMAYLKMMTNLTGLIADWNFLWGNFLAFFTRSILGPRLYLRLHQSYLAPVGTPEHQQPFHPQSKLERDSASICLFLNLRTHQVLLGDTNLLLKFPHQWNLLCCLPLQQDSQLSQCKPSDNRLAELVLYLLHLFQDF